MSKETKIKYDDHNYRNHDERNLRLIEKSLKECGAGRSIVADADGVIIGGNATYKTAQKLNIPTKIIETDGNTLVILKRTDLKTNSKKRKKLALLDNSTGDKAIYDLDNLSADFQLEELPELGLEDLKPIGNDGEENFLTEDPEILNYNENVFFKSTNKYDIPNLRSDMLYDGNVDDICFGVVDKLEENKKYLCLYGQHDITQTATNNIIGFFVDDHRFETVWQNAVKVLDKFKSIQPAAIMTPNFSLWADEPLPYHIMAWYKTQWCGRYWQEAGFKIIPTVNWGNKKDFDFCFLGIPKNAPIVAIQCRNIKTNQEKTRFIDGLLTAKDVLNFKKVVCYGKNILQFKKELKDIDFTVIESWQEKKNKK